MICTVEAGVRCVRLERGKVGTATTSSSEDQIDEAAQTKLGE